MQWTLADFAPGGATWRVTLNNSLWRRLKARVSIWPLIYAKT